MTATPPRLSVIMTADGPLSNGPISLVAAAANRVGQGVEIILIHSSDEPPSEEIEILKAHEAPHPVIGGSVEPDGLREIVNWAAYFCDYGQFMRPLREGGASELPGNNISVKRWVLEHGKEFVAPQFWKAYWCRRLQAEGIRLHSVPSIVVYYRKSFGFVPYLFHRFHSGRCFAGIRLRELSRLRRAFYVAAAPALPIVLTARMLRRTLGKRRHLTELALSLPISLLAIVCWALGELCGYLTGPGVSCDHVR